MPKSFRNLLLTAVLLGMTPSSAYAQFFDFLEWVDRLSGPTLKGQWIDLPIACGYLPSAFSKEVLELNLMRLTTELMGVTPYGPTAPELAALVPQVITNVEKLQARDNRSFSPRQAGRTRIKLCGPLMPDSFVDYSHQLQNLSYERRIVLGGRLGTYGTGHRWPFDGENSLQYEDATADERKVTLITFGPVVSWSIHPKVDLTWTFEANRFSGSLFETFWRPSYDPIGILVRPFAPGWGKPNSLIRRTTGALQVSLRVKQYLGRFTAEDFGATPGTFESENESVLMRGLIGFDFTRLFWPENR